MDDFYSSVLPGIPDSLLLLCYGAATSGCQHELLFTVWDEPVAVFICEGCGAAFAGDSDLMEAELVKPFVEALEHAE